MMWSSSSVLEMHGEKIYNINTKDISLIQDLQFPTCSQYVCITPSQEYIISSGVYPPQLHIHSTQELSLKCSRGLKQDCHRICLLEDGYEKVLLGCKDRWLEVHSQGGEYWKGRASGVIRDVVYNRVRGEAFVGLGSGVCGRLGLEEGRWMQEVELEELGDVRSVVMMNGMELVGFGGGEIIGKVSLWDWRGKEGVVRGLEVSNGSVSCLMSEGLKLYIGDEYGGIGVRDIRMLKDEVWRGEHQYQEEVVRVQRNGEWMVSSDRVGVRVWRNGEVWTEWEPEGGVNWMEVVEGSGMVLIAGEREELGVWFVPGMGVAAKWGQWVEGITEEMEREGVKVNEELKFVGEEEMEDVDVKMLMEKGVVRRYLHGYLMQVGLYQRMREAKEPVREVKRDERNKNDRIVIQKRGKKKVNEEYKGMLEEKGKAGEIFEDERFKDMFTKDKFKVDFEAKEYIQTHPGMQQKVRREEEWVEQVEEEEENEEQRIMRRSQGKSVPFEQRIKKGKQNRIVKIQGNRKNMKGRAKKRPFQKDMKVITKALA